MVYLKAIDRHQTAARILRLVSGCALVAMSAGCSILPSISFEDTRAQTAFVPAARHPDPPAPQVIRVPVPTSVDQQLPVRLAKAAPASLPLDEKTATAKLTSINNGATRDVGRAETTAARQVFEYIPGEIYRVYAAPLRVTSIMLEPGERLISKAAGDTENWLFATTHMGSGDSDRIIFLVKPKVPGAQTNLSLQTDRRAYDLDLVTVAPPGFNMRVGWTYPEEEFQQIEQEVAAKSATDENTIAPQINIKDLNMNYSITTVQGSAPRWKPVQAFDDGHKTYIAFPPDLGTVEAPPLFILNDQQQAQLVNYRPRGNFYEVDRLFDAAELRLGKGEQTIVRIERGAK